MKSYNDFINSCKMSGGRLSYIGKTELGYDIPLLSKGNTRDKVLLVGTTHAREHITTRLLLKLFGEYKGRYSIDLVPSLNIDGMLLARNGINSLPLKLKDRDFLIKINGGSDFSLWKANVRGVDINVNFDAGWGEGKGNLDYPAPSSFIGRAPNSERETECAVRLIEKNKYSLLATYHSKGEEVYWGFRKNNLYKEEALRYASSVGYQLKETLSSAGGLKDYFTDKTKRLGLTIEVGKDSLPHPYPESELASLISLHKDDINLLADISKELIRTHNNY